MNLVRLVYASRFLESKYDTKELARILESAKANNPGFEITGELIFGDDHFLQCLEGGREEVNKLYSKIQQDPRHESLMILSYEEVTKREFFEWSMKMVLLTERTRSLIQKYSETSKFNPFKMKAKSALQLLISIRDCESIQRT